MTSSTRSSSVSRRSGRSTFGGGAATYGHAFMFLTAATNEENNGDYIAAVAQYRAAADTLAELAAAETKEETKARAQARHDQVLKRLDALEAWLEDVANGEETADAPAVSEHGQMHSLDVTDRIEAYRPKGIPPEPSISGIAGLTEKEVTHMHYTPVCSKEPQDFDKDGYTCLTQTVRPHKLRAYATVTMYNEDEHELKGTLTALGRNVRDMMQRGILDWTEFMVCVVSDGRYKANKGTLAWLHSMGLYDQEFMCKHELISQTNVHLFERTCQFISEDKAAGKASWLPPLQIQFALKQHNAQKLDSHQWFFYAFGRHLKPDYAVLVDVGTMAEKSAVGRLITAMDEDDDIGGCCGEIAVDPNQRKCMPYCNSLVSTHFMLDWLCVGTQHFEYKLASVMDKSLESVFGFITVLPGAFSAYRIAAIEYNEEEGHGTATKNADGTDAFFNDPDEQRFPLAEYFDKEEKGLIRGNMYLAEDRILCFELIARRDCRYIMKYCKDAIAYTDVPGNVVDLLKQRRRWLNGSFFASVNAISCFPRFFSQSSHSMGRKVAITVEFVYNTAVLLVAWTLPSTYYLSIYYTLQLTVPGSAIDYIVSGLYVFLVLLQFLFALGNRLGPYESKGTERAMRAFYTFSTFCFGMIMLGIMVPTFLVIASLAGYEPLGLTGGEWGGWGPFPGRTFTCRQDYFNSQFLVSLQTSDTPAFLPTLAKNVQDNPLFLDKAPKNWPEAAGELKTNAPNLAKSWTAQAFISACSSPDQPMSMVAGSTWFSPNTKAHKGVCDDCSGGTEGDCTSTNGVCYSFSNVSNKISCPTSTTKCPIPTKPPPNATTVKECKPAEGKAYPPGMNPGCSAQTDIFTIKPQLTCLFQKETIYQRLHYYILLALSIGSYFIAACFHLEFHHIASYYMVYIFMLPTYINVFQIYSYCNLHDLSWGTKGLESGGGHGKKADAARASMMGDDDNDEQTALKKQEELFKAREEATAAAALAVVKKDNEFKFFRSALLCFFVVTNGILIVSVRSTYSGGCFLKFLLYLVACMNGTKLICAIIFSFGFYTGGRGLPTKGGGKATRTSTAATKSAVATPSAGMGSDAAAQTV